MEQKLKKAFNVIKYETSADLQENIWKTIKIREERDAQIKLWSFSILGICSLIGLIPMLKILFSDLTQSGFFEYLSLAFGNSGYVFAYFKEYSLSIAESLPIISLTLSLSLIFVLFLSTKYTIKQIIRSNYAF